MAATPGVYNRIFQEYLTSATEFVVVSPHLDDAVFSMGGLMLELARMNKSIHVISIFTTGSDLESENVKKLARWGGCNTTDEYFAARKIEDTNALQMLGNITHQNLDFIDAAWRTNAQGTPLYIENVIGVIDEADRVLIETIAKRLAEVLPNAKNKVIFAPLAIGRHVDHYLTREACTQVFTDSVYYTDFPYIEKYPNEDEFIAQNNLVKAVWTVADHTLKNQAMHAYKTQVRGIFGKYKMELTNETYYFRNRTTRIVEPLLVFGKGPILNKITRERAADAHTPAGSEDLPYLSKNIAMAASLLAIRNGLHDIFVMGGKTGGPEYSAESELIKRDMVALGVLDEYINCDKQSENTVENYLNFVNRYDTDDPKSIDLEVSLLGTISHLFRLKALAKLFHIPVASSFAAEDVLGNEAIPSSGMGIETIDDLELTILEHIWMRYVMQFPERLLGPIALVKNSARFRIIIDIAFKVYSAETLAQFGLTRIDEASQRAALLLIKYPLHTPDEKLEIVRQWKAEIARDEPWPAIVQERYDVLKNLVSG